MIFTFKYISKNNFILPDTRPVLKRIFTLVQIVILILICTIHMGFAEPKRIALVVGNSAYQDSPLANPVNDARLIAKILRDLNFLVLEHLDVDQQKMKRIIQSFGDHLDKAGRDAVALFYYAGHGIQVNGANYLIPVNATIQKERDVEIEAVNAAAVLGVIDYARTRINFVVIDACRNNPFARSFRSANRGLARMDAPQGTLVAYATAPGDVASDGKADNSPYSFALANAMQNPGMPVEQMFKIVRRDVMAKTDNSQVPWESSSLIGNFYFKGSATDAQSHTLHPQPGIDKEALFWQSIKDSKAIEEYEEYLRQFPNGVFTSLAQKRIDFMKSSPSAAIGPESVETNTQDLSGVTDTLKESDDAVLQQIPGEQIKDQPIIYGAELEPNNTIGTSNFIRSRSIFKGQINPKGDADWYAFSVRRQGALEISITNVPSEMDFVFRIWNSEYQTIANWFAPLRKGAETTGVVDLVTAGTYYLELRDSHDDSASAQPYQLSMNFKPTNDAHEPNNSFGTAALLIPGSKWFSAILPKGDSDWYRFNIDRHGELNILANGVPMNLDISMRLWNADKRAITNWFGPLKEGGDTNAIIDIPQPGSYVLEVRDGRDNSRSASPFLTTTSYKPSIDRFEPNNSFGHAASLAIGETVKGTILPIRDSDWFRIEVDEQGELKVNITDVQKDLDIVFRVWNGEIHAMTNWFAPLKAGGDTGATIDLPMQGSYLIEIRDGRDDARSVSPYSLRATFKPTRDRGEPNNSFGTAVPLKIGSPVSGVILPKGEADWYRVSLGQPCTLVVHISESPANLDMVMRIWDKEKHTISNWISPLRAGGESKGEVTIPKAGAYFIEVHDGRDDSRSIKPYRLTAIIK